MKIVNSIVIFFFLILFTCSKNSSKSSKDILNSSISYVNYEADSVFYKIDIACNDQKLYRDEKSNLIFLVTKEVYFGDKKIGNYNQSNWFNELKEYSKNSNKLVYLVTKVSIKKNDGVYDDIWEYKNEITINKDGYGVNDLVVSLGDSYAEFNKKLQSRLNINFKTKNSDNGYKQYTLNYINKNGQWLLVSRERICTISNDINNEQIGYCVDTINYKCKITEKKFYLTNDDLFNLGNEICNGEK
ncbi:MAG: hypothetical protein QM535_01040 [Limnohabitans sp.]|nr:hypothetical protein [Limnohabitans sp.]